MLRRIEHGLAGLSVGLLAACGSIDEQADVVGVDVGVVDGQANFSVLSEAINAAGLRAKLISVGPFTLSPPTDAALLTELGLTRTHLLADTDTQLLTTVLTHHVLPAKLDRAGVPVGTAITTVRGGIFKVTRAGSGLASIDGRNRSANIIATDAQADNGVFYAIDSVLLPANRNIV